MLRESVRLKKLLFPAFHLVVWALSPPMRAEVFDFSHVQDQAQHLAGQSFHEPDTTLPAELDHLSYTQVRSLLWKESSTLWGQDHLPFQVKFSHRSNLRPAVKIYLCDGNRVTPFPYSEDNFRIQNLAQPQSLPKDLGYAGVRLYGALDLKHPERLKEFLVFLDASYFRAIGQDQTFGLSARGLSIDSGISGVAEEFPRFTTFWLQRPLPGAKKMTLYALLDSPSVTGAYAFDITPGLSSTLEIRSTLFFRKAVQNLGIAPLTSMFWYGAGSLNHFGDFRPEVHDSDGALILNGQGDWHWHPLQNVETILWTRSLDLNPKGFGLLQREQGFAHYEDLEACYHLRPSAWVTPRGNWGPGHVCLVQLPTRNEYKDNVVLFWQPERPPKAGERLDFNYQLSWYSPQDQEAPLASCSRMLIDYPRPGRSNALFLLDFAGTAVTGLPEGTLPQPIVSTSDGRRITDFEVIKNPYTQSYRITFFTPPLGPHQQSIDLSCRLQNRERPLSEIWNYTWIPAPEIRGGPELTNKVGPSPGK